MESAKAEAPGGGTRAEQSGKPFGGGEDDNFVRHAVNVAWRARGFIVPLAIVSAALAVAAPFFTKSGAAVYFWMIAGLVFVLGLVTAIVLRVRSYIVELSQQILDVADGASKPPEGAVMSALEIEAELSRLRKEIEALKVQRGGDRTPD